MLCRIIHAPINSMVALRCFLLCSAHRILRSSGNRPLSIPMQCSTRIRIFATHLLKYVSLTLSWPPCEVLNAGTNTCEG
ncbi:hypothetical protein PR002_g3283 [Phytophthora rubi]|uniref:Secreted protein n=1 Tax=Phytophthora rubi TaxID=129364 RepID=A0A6A3NJV7_9STRA|nr:hypothetical protein PR002_g3283 [Phytophthora rubi]